MFSVVIPLYNKQEFIKRAIDSVLSQSFTNYEIILVDDGSTDRSLDVVNSYKNSRINVIQQKNAGVSAARNKGIVAARYEWVAFLDADDEWTHDHLQVISDVILKYPAIVALGTAYNKIDTQGNVRRLRHPYSISEKTSFQLEDYFLFCVQYDHPLHSSSAVVRRDVLMSIGGFPVNIRAGEDLITWAKLAAIGTIGFSTKVTANFYIPDQRSDNRKQNIRRPAFPDLVAIELSKLFAVHKVKSIKFYIGFWHEIRSVSFMELDERVNCLNELVKSICNGKLKRKHWAILILLFFPKKIRGKFLENWRNGKAKS